MTDYEQPRMMISMGEAARELTAPIPHTDREIVPGRYEIDVPTLITRYVTVIGDTVAVDRDDLVEAVGQAVQHLEQALMIADGERRGMKHVAEQDGLRISGLENNVANKEREINRLKRALADSANRRDDENDLAESEYNVLRLENASLEDEVGKLRYDNKELRQKVARMFTGTQLVVAVNAEAARIHGHYQNGSR